GWGRAGVADFGLGDQGPGGGVGRRPVLARAVREVGRRVALVGGHSRLGACSPGRLGCFLRPCSLAAPTAARSAATAVSAGAASLPRSGAAERLPARP